MVVNQKTGSVSAGEGPGIPYADPKHWLWPLTLLIIATAGLLWALYGQWPRCEVPSCASASGCSEQGAPSWQSAVAALPDAHSTVPSATLPVPNLPTATPSTVTSAPSSDPSPAGTTQAAPNTAPATQTDVGSAQPLRIATIAPTSGTICGGTPVTITGSGFSVGTLDVRFGGIRALMTDLSKDHTSIIVTTPQHWEAPVDITVSVDDKSATVVKGYNYICSDRTQARLLLLVMLAGALGGTLHGLRSLFYFVGNRTLKVSWLPMYFVLPFSGAAISTVFFLVFVAGFFSPQAGDGQSFFLMVGVSALVGMFSQQAVEKLKKISEAILTSVPPSSDPASEPLSLLKLEPTTGSAAGKTAVVLTGTGFAKDAIVTFGEVSVIPTSLTSQQLTVETPSHAIGKVNVEVINPDGNKATKLSGFEYT